MGTIGLQVSLEVRDRSALSRYGTARSIYATVFNDRMPYLYSKIFPKNRYNGKAFLGIDGLSIVADR